MFRCPCPCICDSSDENYQALAPRNHTAILVQPPLGCGGPRRPVKMPSNACDVIYEGKRKAVKFNNCSTFRAVEERIRQVFVEIRERERFHLVLYKNKREYDIRDDADVTLLDSNAIRNAVRGAISAVNGGTHPLEIRVYSGGPFSIWLRGVEHSITEVPKSNTYLVYIAIQSVFPNFTKRGFGNDLNKLMHSIKLANYCIIMTGNQGLKYEPSMLVRRKLRPVIDRCTDTFCDVHNSSVDILDKITYVITKLQDGLDEYVEPLLKLIRDQATKIEKESEDCITDLKRVESDISDVLQKVQEQIPGNHQEIVGHLEKALGAIGKVSRVMSDMKSFWADVKTAIEFLISSSFMSDIRVSVAKPEAGFKEEHKKMARHLWRTKKFKMNGIAFIAKHAAIRDVCQDCKEPMKRLQEQLSTFLESDLPSSQEAEQEYDKLKKEAKPWLRPATGGNQPFTTTGEMDDGTVAELKDALGMSYNTTLRKLTSVPVQETGEADVHLPTEVANAGDDAAVSFDNLEI